MGNPNYQSISATGTGTPVILDWTVVPFNVSFAVELQGSSTATFGVQYTLDDVNDGSRSATWYYDSNVGSGTTGTFVGNYMFPVRAVRLETTALSANGSIVFAVLQGLPV